MACLFLLYLVISFIDDAPCPIAVRGMMYYRKALMLQAYLERMTAGGWPTWECIDFLFLASLARFLFSVNCALDTEAATSKNEVSDTQGFELSRESRAQADLKFTYVVTCQIYGKQKEDRKPEAADIALLMQRWCNTHP